MGGHSKWQLSRDAHYDGHESGGRAFGRTSASRQVGEITWLKKGQVGLSQVSTFEQSPGAYQVKLDQERDEPIFWEREFKCL